MRFRSALLVVLFAASCERADKTERRPLPPAPRDATLVEPYDIALTIDMSKSMEETDLPRDRLDASVRALHKLVDGALPGERLAIVLYAQRTVVRLPLTADVKAIHG